MVSHFAVVPVRAGQQTLVAAEEQICSHYGRKPAGQTMAGVRAAGQTATSTEKTDKAG